MQWHRGSAAILTATVVLTACWAFDGMQSPLAPGQGGSAGAGNEAPSLRVVNAIADGGVLGVGVNGAATTQSLGFRGTTGCLPATVGANSVTFTQGANTPLLSASGTVSAGGRATVIATGTVAQPQVLILEDAFTPAAAGRARLRLLNAAPTAGAFDVFVTEPDGTLGRPVASELSFNAAANFLDVPAGATQVRFTAPGTRDIRFNSGAFALNDGQARTIILTEAVGGGAPFGAVTFDSCR